MNAVTGAVLALRVVYAIFYIRTTTQRMSRMRSAVWGVSVAVLMGVYGVAGRRWAGRA
jgi:uncharacterized MAPEG superfamily protein